MAAVVIPFVLYGLFLGVALGLVMRELARSRRAHAAPFPPATSATPFVIDGDPALRSIVAGYLAHLPCSAGPAAERGASSQSRRHELGGAA